MEYKKVGRDTGGLWEKVVIRDSTLMKLIQN